jgi:hypothetical protein
MLSHLFLRAKLPLLFALISAVSFAQQEEKIIWKALRPLTWDDFIKLEKGKNRFAAESMCGLAYSVRQEGDRIIIETEAYLIQSGSWVVESKQTKDLLNHEQLHFDIAELWNRKLHKRLRKYELPVKSFVDRNIAHKLEIEYKRCFAEMMKIQRTYDRET